MDLGARTERARQQWRYRGGERPRFAVAPREGQESVWDYPRPPRFEAEPRRVRIVHEGALVADSRRAVRVLETASPPTFYLPARDVQPNCVQPAGAGALCEWKGRSEMLDVRTATGVIRAAGWRYPDPFPEFEALRGWCAFYAGRLECYVGPERARPQPGRFYGGWITAELVGPFKGEPGSQDW